MRDVRNLTTSITNKLGRKVLDVCLFLIFLKRYLKREYNIISDKPSIWIDLNGNGYVRYSYLVTKFFELEGYQVYLKPNITFILSLGNAYAKLIIKEKKTLWSSEKQKNSTACFSDNKLNTGNCKTISNDYFLTILNKNKNSYHIPIGMHPYFYHKDLWNSPVDYSDRKYSIFFAGNFNEIEYKRLEKDNKFNMMDRVSLGKALQSLPNANFPNTREELMSNLKDGQINIVKLENFGVPMEELRQNIANYYFYIACPGVVMPLSHNVIEAMSVGTIPIIHKEYAKMFCPKLEDYYNAILYDDQNFCDKLDEALKISPDHVKSMSEKVLSYYNMHLTPAAVVKELLNPKYDTFFLNAERTSVKLMTGKIQGRPEISQRLEYDNVSQ